MTQRKRISKKAQRRRYKRFVLQWAERVVVTGVDFGSSVGDTTLYLVFRKSDDEITPIGIFHVRSQIMEYFK